MCVWIRETVFWCVVCSPSWRFRLLIGLVGVLTVACANSGLKDPTTTLHAYAHALDDGRAQDAYRLLSDEARRTRSFAEFREMIQKDPEAARETAKILLRPSSEAA